jgi:FkbH-like protein
MDTSCPETLLDLYRAGRLAADYPRVRTLLAEATEAELQRAGQLLGRLDPDEVLRHHADTPQVRIAATGHGNLAMLMPPLTAELARHGLLLRPTLTDFDSYVPELSDPAGELHSARPDLALLVLDPMVVLDDLPTPWTLDAVQAAVEHRITLVEGLVERFVAHSDATLVVNTLPLPRRFTVQLIDYRSRARLGTLWREANTRLLRLGDDQPQVVALDLDPLLADGVPASDPRLSAYTGAHLSAPLLAAYAREVTHLARHLTGRTKKCLAVDLDQTLWGGVLSEDGREGIEVGDGLRGKAFTAFQRVLAQLASQGVLLSAVSKNDLAPVREVLCDHPGMTLREDDFVQIRADWTAKPAHLREIADTIGIGLDSFVFVDDSPHECGLVRTHCPQVDVVPLDEEPALHVEKLLADGWFTVRAVTAEDTERTALYRAEAARGELRTAHADLDDYLRDLLITVTIGPVEPAEIARVSQLTLRTNQFNLTTERLQPAAVQQRADDPDASVLAVHVSDRFGSSGLTGAVFLRRTGDVLTVDNFLLSCRVLARGVEQACLAAVLHHAKARGVDAVEAAYRPTAKNAKVRDLYPSVGFEEIGGDTTSTSFRHGLDQLPDVPDHIRLIDRSQGAER